MHRIIMNAKKTNECLEKKKNNYTLKNKQCFENINLCKKNK